MGRARPVRRWSTRPEVQRGWVGRSWGYTLRTKAKGIKGIVDGLDVDNERKQRAEKDAF